MKKPNAHKEPEFKKNSEHKKLDILYEDAYIVVIDKPSGMLSVPYPGGSARTAIGVLERIMRDKGTYAKHRKPLAVHRLDRDTSGVMLFALTERVKDELMRFWHGSVTERIYRAVAENPAGSALPDSGLIDEPLAYNAYNRGFVPDAEKRARFDTVEARTRYKVIERGATHTLFELSLDTGKKNQIRAHLASKGCPIAGDETHRARTDPFCRLALHARTIEFVHPATHKTVRFEVPEPEAWLEYVRRGDEKPELPVWRKKREMRGKPALLRDFAASQKGGKGGAVYEKNNN